MSEETAETVRRKGDRHQALYPPEPHQDRRTKHATRIEAEHRDYPLQPLTTLSARQPGRHGSHRQTLKGQTGCLNRDQTTSVLLRDGWDGHCTNRREQRPLAERLLAR